MYLLDTDISIFAIRGNQNVLKKLATLPAGDWAISVVTNYEIRKGVAANPNTRASIRAQAFLEAVDTLDFGAEASEHAARVFQELKLEGRSIGTADELIAGHALSLEATLVTNNTRHFKDVPGLKLESWL